MKKKMTIILIQETSEEEEEELFIRLIAITDMENTTVECEKKNVIDNVAVLTYHKNHNVVTCVCGSVVNGKHLCDIKTSTKIQIKECCYKSSSDNNENCCWICLKKEKDLEYENQWKEDEDGYCYCVFCGDKCDDELPKCCSCNAYVDFDGEKKCKSCHKGWNELDMEKECLLCECRW